MRCFFILFTGNDERRNSAVMGSGIFICVEITWRMKADIDHTSPFQTDATTELFFVLFLATVVAVVCQ